MPDTRSRHLAHELNVYPRRDVAIVRGQNARVWDDTGREYIDCIAGHGTVNVGHCNRDVARALAAQAQILISCPGVLFNDQRALLFEKLAGLAPSHLKRVFLCNSGTEAVEAALKFARMATGRTGFVAAVRGFHGRTFGAMSATHEPKYREACGPFVPGFEFVPFNNFDRLQKAVNPDTAGIILEVVQGEGGVNIAQKPYLKKVRELCTERDVLLILDEVQTGFCRTGTMFACEQYEVSPDILCLAKSMAGGLPAGAVLCAERVTVPISRHGSTFGGNPLVAAASLAAIDFMIREDLAGQAREKGEYFAAKCADLPPARVREFRHLGLMIGIELKEKAQPYLVRLMEEGVLALPAGPNVIRLLPPLTIPYEDLDLVAGTLSAVLA